MQDQSEIVTETTRTTTTIKKSIIIIAVVIGITAAFSQLFSEVKPKELVIARANNIYERENRDFTRDEILILLENHLINKTISKESFDKEATQLLSNYNLKAEKSNIAKAELDKIKANLKVRGFANLNIFLANIGLSIFGWIMSILIYLFYLFLKREKYIVVAKILKFVSQAMFITFSIYILWALYPANDLNRFVYIMALLVVSYNACKGLYYILKKNFFTLPYIQYDKLRNAVSLLFEALIIDVNDKFISEDQKKEYINFYDEQIDKVDRAVK